MSFGNFPIVVGIFYLCSVLMQLGYYVHYVTSANKLIKDIVLYFRRINSLVENYLKMIILESASTEDKTPFCLL